MDRSMAVLIVDDHQPMRRTIADIMRSLGFDNLFYAEDGQMAWEKMQENAYDLILLDWNMPRLSGVELLQRIRMAEDEATPPLPVLMVTAEAEREQVVEAIKTGVTNYIVKPFAPATLERKLYEIFGKSENEPEEQS